MIRPHRPLAGSRPAHLDGATPVGPADADRRIQVTIVLRPSRLPRTHPARIAARRHAEAWPTERVPLTDAEFIALNAPPAEAVKAVLGVARRQGQTIVDVSPARHDIIVEAPIAVIERAYRVRQLEYEHERGRYRAHQGPAHLPRQLHSLVEGVLGLDTIPHGRAHGRPAAGRASPGLPALAARDLAALYRFPPAPSVHGRVAILEFGGGVHREDLAALRRRSRIRVFGIVDGDGPTTRNSPLEQKALREIARAWQAGISFEELTARYGSQLAAFMETVEATMDAEIVAGLVPSAPVDLVFAPSCADGWRRAIYAEIGFPYPDSVVGPALSRKPPAVLSVSWGMAERSWGRMKLQVLHGTLRAAVRRGTTVCCSTGDFGAQNTPQRGVKRSVNYPATSTWALACGGTALVRDGAGHREVGWLESLLGSTLAGGGGMSGHFAAPRYQAGVVKPKPGNTWLAGKRRTFKGRWIPDVAAHAGFEPGVALRLLGRRFVGGGTSAATPIWAALVARLAAVLGRPLGWLNPALYAVAAGGTFRDIRQGHNDLRPRQGKPVHYRATVGWDPCTGLGAPDGTALLEALRLGPPK